MACILITGRNRNHLKHALAGGGLTASGGDVSSNFPLSGLCDEDTLPFQFGSKAANRYLQIDNNALLDGGFELSGANGVTPAAWTVKTGTFVTSTTTPDTGSTYCAMLGASGHLAYRIELRPAGEAFTFVPRARGGGAGVAANVRVINLDSGYSLNTGGVWVAGSSTYLINGYTTTTYTGTAVSGVVQSAALCGSELVRIMVVVDQSGGSAGNTRYDNLAWIPHTNFLALFGHNIPPAIATTLYRSATGAFAGEEVPEVVLTSQPRNMYYAGSTLRTERFWRVSFVGTVDSGLPSSADTAVKPIGITEGFLGQKTVLTQPQDFDYEHVLAGDQGRSVVGGLTRVYSRNPAPAESWELAFRSPTPAAYAELRDAVYATQLGAVKAVLVPDDTRPECAYGQIAANWKASRRFLGIWDAQLSLASMPAAVFVS